MTLEDLRKSDGGGGISSLGGRSWLPPGEVGPGGTGRVHPTAVLETGAQVHPTVEIGPYAVIGPEVKVGPGCRIESHAVIKGRTLIGEENLIGHHAVLGELPQVRECLGRGGELVIGDRNWFRELVTVHVGSPGERTSIGGQNIFMAYSHVAHDCVLGSGIELANGVQLAGHVTVGDHVILGGLAAVHQHVRLGAFAFVGAGAMVSQDVPPFTMASGDRARLYGLNVVGLRRHGFGPEVRRDLGRALRLLLHAPTLAEGIEQVRASLPPSEPLTRLVEFAATSRRGLCAMVVSRGGKG